MFSSELELLEAIRSKFSGATSLSRTESGYCYYSRQLNGIGCAIGCLLPESICNDLDRHNVSVDTAMSMDKFRGLLLSYFPDGVIEVDLLRRLQCYHDLADDVEEFVHRLDAMIASGRYSAARGEMDSYHEEV